MKWKEVKTPFYNGWIWEKLSEDEKWHLIHDGKYILLVTSFAPETDSEIVGLEHPFEDFAKGLEMRIERLKVILKKAKAEARLEAKEKARAEHEKLVAEWKENKKKNKEKER